MGNHMFLAATGKTSGSSILPILFIAALFVVLGPDLTGVLFSTNVTSTDARFIGTVTAAFALGLPAFSAQYVALRGFYAQEDTRTPFLLQVLIAAVNVVLALVAGAALLAVWVRDGYLAPTAEGDPPGSAGRSTSRPSVTR